MERKSRVGVFLVLLAGASWGVISIFIRRLSSAGLSSIDISALRSVAAAILLLATVPWFNRQAFAIRWRDFWCLAGCGVASITLFNICYFATMQRTIVGVAVVLLYTSPIFVSVFSYFCFREPLGRRKIIAILLVLLGCVCVSGVLESKGTVPLPPSALLLGILSGFSYGMYSIFGRFAQQRGYSTSTITLWAFLTSAVALAFLAKWHDTLAIFSATPSLWGWLAALVGISTLLPYVAYTAGLRRLTPSLAAILASVEPVVGTLVGILYFHENLTWGISCGILPESVK